MLFRQFHFVVDCAQGQVDDLTLWNYANYQSNLFALVAGPIQRFQDFCASWRRLALPADRHEILLGFLRVFLGLIKMAGLAAAVYFVYEKSRARLVAGYSQGLIPGAPKAAALFAAVFYLYPLYVYLNFSGYCDVAIGAASLAGIRLPENFDRPYLSRNMLDFWTRWHRTLGFWIRDYLFTPVYKFLAERVRAPVAVLAAFSYFVAFLFAGVWHGTTSNFAVFGALHGLGASAAKVWEILLVKRRGRAYFKQYLQSAVVRVTAILLTLHFFCFTMIFFSGPLQDSMAPLLVLKRSIEQALAGGRRS